VFYAYNGIESYSTAFNVQIQYNNGTLIDTKLDAERYKLLDGTYNRKNIYGAVFSQGPFFDNEKLIKIRQGILDYAVCDPGAIVKEFGVPGDVKSISENSVNLTLDAPGNVVESGHTK
jgi:hypothetical protein